jgi:cell division protein FtsB
VSAATKKRKQLDLPIAHFIAVIVLSISLFLIIDFGRRAATGYRVRREEDRLRSQMEAAQKTQETLLARLDYVATDAYVEEIARNELKWSKPGEVVVVIMPTPQMTASSPASSRPTPGNSPPATPLQAWLELFFTAPNLLQTPN